MPIYTCQVREGTRGFTLIELLIVVSIIGIIAAIAIPGLLRARMVANETSAVGSLRAISTGQAAYASACAQSGYATTLPVLSVSPPGGGQAFLSADLTSAATVTKTGYSVTMDDGGSPAGMPDCNGTGTSTGFYAAATPLSLSSTGSRAFAVDQGGAIYYSNTAVAPDPANTGIPLN